MYIILGGEAIFVVDRERYDVVKLYTVGEYTLYEVSARGGELVSVDEAVEIAENLGATTPHAIILAPDAPESLDDIRVVSNNIPWKDLAIMMGKIICENEGCDHIAKLIVWWIS